MQRLLSNRLLLGLVAILVAAVGCDRPAPSLEPSFGAPLKTLSESPTPPVHHLLPDFVGVPTHTTVRSGPWSDPDVWDRRSPPGLDDRARVSQGHEVIYDVASDLAIDTVQVDGTLRFAVDRDTRLTVDQVIVSHGGSLLIGTATQPIEQAQAEIVLADGSLQTGAADSPGLDPWQWGGGLLVQGTLTIHGAPRSPGWVRVTAETNGGNLRSEEPLSGWRRGDEIDLSGPLAPSATSSRFSLLGVDPQSLRLAVGTSAAIGAAGNGTSGYASNLSRSVLMRSQNPAGRRGHVIFLGGARISVKYARFENLGRTTLEPLDDTHQSPEGDLIVGTNPPGRYPLHLHHTVSEAAPGDADTFELVGNVVLGAPRWWLVVHASHFGRIEDNVVIGAHGAGIVTEDGSETGNRFVHNLVAGVVGSGLDADTRRAAEGLGHEGAGFWMASEGNQLVGNAATNVVDGFSIFRDTSALPPPLFGATGRQGCRSLAEGANCFEFADNEVDGAERSGLRLWSGPKECQACGGENLEIVDLRVRNAMVGVTFDYHADYYDIEGLHVTGPLGRLDSFGVVANDSRRGSLRRSHIQRVGTGIEIGGSRTRAFELSEVSIEANVGIRLLRGSALGDTGPTRLNEVRITVPEGGKAVEIEWQAYNRREIAWTTHQPILVTNFQAESDADFEIFANEQAPDYPIQQHRYRLHGCPEAGMSNAQCWAAHGIAIGGQPAPCNDRLAGVDGYTCSGTESPDPQSPRRP